MTDSDILSSRKRKKQSTLHVAVRLTSYLSWHKENMNHKFTVDMCTIDDKDEEHSIDLSVTNDEIETLSSLFNGKGCYLTQGEYDNLKNTIMDSLAPKLGIEKNISNIESQMIQLEHEIPDEFINKGKRKNKCIVIPVCVVLPKRCTKTDVSNRLPWLEVNERSIFHSESAKSVNMDKTDEIVMSSFVGVLVMGVIHSISDNCYGKELVERLLDCMIKSKIPLNKEFIKSLVPKEVDNPLKSNESFMKIIIRFCDDKNPEPLAAYIKENYWRKNDKRTVTIIKLKEIDVYVAKYEFI